MSGTGASGTGLGGTGALDHKRLLAEIDAEVRERRESGDIPPDFERELEAVFNRFAPPSVSDDFDSVLERAERLTLIDADAPVASRLPAGTFIKKVLRKLTGFIVAYVARNVTAFASTITRALKLLGRRVDRLEAAVPAADPHVLEELAAVEKSDLSLWSDRVRASLTGGPEVPGRIAVVECGGGQLLASLAAAGLDVYGVEPDVDTADELVDAGLEVRADDARTHLRRVPPQALRAVVLVGCIERMPVGALLELVDLATSRVVPGGRVVVVSRSPSMPGITDDAATIAADLMPVRPLHARTWEHLLAVRGLIDISTELEPTAALEPLVPVAGNDEVARVMNANLARLSAALFGAPSYLVAGTCARE